MKPYLFILGRSTLLCEAELRSLLASSGNSHSLAKLSDELILGELSKELDAQKLMEKSGGLIKIARVLFHTSGVSPELLAEKCFPKDIQSLTFGISNYTSQAVPLEKWLPKIKDVLSKNVTQVRYVTSRDGVLSSVVIAKQQVYELIIAFDETKNEWIVGKTLAVQDFEDWNRRDYDRPAVYPGAGMLPPKVARMMINIGVSNAKLQMPNAKEQLTLLDPFCGVGTILAEGLLSGLHVIGNDVSPEQIEKTRKNLEWLTLMYRYIDTLKWELMVSDATHLTDKIAPQSVDIIVTEPFMGALFSREVSRSEIGLRWTGSRSAGENRGGDLYQKGKKATADDVKNIVRGLEKLYIGALKEWQTILKPQGVVAMILPEIMFAGRPFFVKKVIDTCENLGYTLSQGPFPYSRPQAVVKRKIYIFKKK